MASLPISSINGTVVFLPPPSGYVVNFQNPARRLEETCYVLSGIGIFLSTIFVFQNAYVKLLVQRKPDLEICFVALSYAFAIAVQAIVIHAYRVGVMGTHAWEMPITQFMLASKYLIFGPLMFSMNTLFSKVSLLIFYKKLSPQVWWQYSTWITAIVVVGYNVAAFFCVLFGCVPVEANWDLRITDRRCINRQSMYIVFSGFGILTDLILLVMPIPIIAGLQMPTRQKIGLVILFALGSATLITSIIRCIVLVPLLTSLDIAWVSASSMVLVAAESNLQVMCACLTTLRAFFKHVAPACLGERSTSKSWKKSDDSARIKNHGFKTIGSLEEGSKRRVDQFGMTIDRGDMELESFDHQGGKFGKRDLVVVRVEDQELSTHANDHVGAANSTWDARTPSHSREPEQRIYPG